MAHIKIEQNMAYGVVMLAIFHVGMKYASLGTQIHYN